MSAAEIPVPKHPGVFRRGSRYTMRVKDGRGHTRRVSGRSLAEVQAKAAAMRTDIIRGEWQPASAERFDAYARRWIKTYPGRTSRGFREETREEYRKVLERHAIPYFGSRRLSSITPADVRALIEHISKGRKPNTIRLAVAPLRCLFADAAEQGTIRMNPARGVRVGSLVRDDGDQVHALSDKDLARFMTAVPDQYRLFTRFMCETALRISEAAELRWRDLDLAGLQLTVSRRFRERRVAPPKSRAGVRTIPLSPELAQALWQQRKDIGAANDDALVWPGRNGKHLDATSVARWCQKAAATAGVTCTPHVWRHTCITNLLRAGLSVKQAQVWAGHANPSITLSVYADAMAGSVEASPFGGGNQVGISHTETGRNDDAEQDAVSAQPRGVLSLAETGR